jgi:hypothetical protein
LFWKNSFDLRSEIAADNTTRYPMTTELPQKGPRLKTMVRVRNLVEDVQKRFVTGITKREAGEKKTD